jgi:hypothetical protein
MNSRIKYAEPTTIINASDMLLGQIGFVEKID